MHGQQNVKKEKFCEFTVSPNFHEKRGFRSDLGYIITWQSDCQHGCQSTIVRTVKSVTCILDVFSMNHAWDTYCSPDWLCLGDTQYLQSLSGYDVILGYRRLFSHHFQFIIYYKSVTQPCII